MKKVLIAKRILLIKSIGNKGIIVWIIFMMILSSQGLAAELFLGIFVASSLFHDPNFTEILQRTRYEFPSSTCSSVPLNPMKKQNPSKSVKYPFKKILCFLLLSD